MLNQKEIKSLNVTIFSLCITSPLTYILISYFLIPEQLGFNFQPHRSKLVFTMFISVFIFWISKVSYKRSQEKYDLFKRTLEKYISLSLLVIYPSLIGMLLSFYFGRIYFCFIGNFISIPLGVLLLQNLKQEVALKKNQNISVEKPKGLKFLSFMKITEGIFLMAYSMYVVLFISKGFCINLVKPVMFSFIYIMGGVGTYKLYNYARKLLIFFACIHTFGFLFFTNKFDFTDSVGITMDFFRIMDIAFIGYFMRTNIKKYFLDTSKTFPQSEEMDSK